MKEDDKAAAGRAGRESKKRWAIQFSVNGAHFHFGFGDAYTSESIGKCAAFEIFTTLTN